MSNPVTVTVETDAVERQRLLAAEQASLRRVATLIASGASAAELFAAVTDEVGPVLNVPRIALFRFEGDSAITVVASHNAPGFPLGARLPLDGPVTRRVFETGRPARYDDYAQVSGSLAESVRASGSTSIVGAPIIVDNAVWGMLGVGGHDGTALPDDTEQRVSAFSELVGIAVANAAARDRLEGLAGQQAALRRIATLIAGSAPTELVGTAVLDEAARVVGVAAAWLVRYEADDTITVVASLNDPTFPPGSRWPLDGESLSSRVRDTGRPARIDDYTQLEGTLAVKTRESGIVSVAGAPVTVEGEVWGAICVGAADALVPNAEDRLREFTELISTDISNAAARGRLARLLAEQSALHRVATLVAEQAPTPLLFKAVSEEVARVLDLPWVELARYDGGGATVLGAAGDYPFPIGTTWPLDGPSIMAHVLRTGRPARIDDYGELPGTIAAAARSSGMHAAIGAPIVVDGAIWGSFVAIATTPGGLAEPGMEQRLAAFAELVATAISNAESRGRVTKLAQEQASLRRVATLIAESAAPEDVFAAVAEEVARVLEVSSIEIIRYDPDGNATVIGGIGEHPFTVGSRSPVEPPSIRASVFETGAPARIDDYSTLRGAVAEAAWASGLRSAIGAPIVVDGATWGVIVAGGTSSERFADDAETRLRDFTELVATAVSNLQAHDDLSTLVDEQAALRRIATLVAEGADMHTVFDAVCEEAGRLLGATTVNLSRYTPDGFNVTMEGWSVRDTHVPAGRRFPITVDTVAGKILASRSAARVESWESAPSELAELVRSRGIRSSVGAPVIVEGTVWGGLVAATDQDEQLPPSTERRLASFTEIVATAVSSAEARDAERRLLEEQAALRRLGALVVEGATQDDLFTAAAQEVTRVLDVRLAAVVRYEPGNHAKLVGRWGEGNPYPAGTTSRLDGTGITGLVRTTRRSARVDDYASVPGPIAARLAREAWIQGAVGAPILVGAHLWGAVVALASEEQALPADAEERLSGFTDFIASAIAHSEARDGERRLTEEQAALRRVATLVAEGAAPAEVFAAVTDEVASVLGLPAVVLERFEPDNHVTVLATAGEVSPWDDAGYRVGTRWPMDGPSVVRRIYETGRPATIDDYSTLPGTMASYMRSGAEATASGVPIMVDGKVWGAMSACTTDPHSRLPADVDTRLTRFTELVATAVSNATGRADLIESRARIVAAGDEARRRIERDLHDGTQQRLIALGLDLQRIRALISVDPAAAVTGLERTEGDLQALLEEVRQLSSSLHPPLLSRHGFVPALRALARRSPVPVDIDVELRERPPAAIETALFYVASEAITNAIKHSQATEISVSVETDHAGGSPFGIGIDGRRAAGRVYATIADDGIGGADVAVGSGLSGLADRVDALGGRFTLDSPHGEGTRISVMLPLG